MGLRSEQFEAAFRAGLSLMEKMRPRDPLERLALMQALLAHARAALLTIKLAGAQASELPVISEATERAAGTFARLMRAFDDHRQPRNSSATVSIGQANLGHQQIVQNVQIEEAGGKKNVDKQTRIQAKSPTIAIKTLPPHETGTQIPASDHPKITAMDEKQRSENPKRKIQGREKRHETRPAVSGRRRASKTLASHD
jgi:hypothetical protein